MNYTVLINSKTYQSTETPDPNNKGYLAFNIDWSFLPQGKKYKVGFALVSKSSTLINSSNVIQLHANFTASPEVYFAQYSYQRIPTNFIGILKCDNVPTATTTEYRLVASFTDNAPIMIHDRPSNNAFVIRMYDVDGAAFTFDMDYVLTLSFEEINI
jgi:hypothetical protein